MTENISRVGIDYEVDAKVVVTEMIDRIETEVGLEKSLIDRIETEFGLEKIIIDRIETEVVDLEKITSDEEEHANNVNAYVTIGSNNEEENLKPAFEALITNSEVKEKPLEQMVKEITLGKVLKNHCG